MVDVNTLEFHGEDGLMAVLSGVTDPRKPRGVRHNQAFILAVAVCACLGGMRSLAAIGEWGQRLGQVLLKRPGCSWNYGLAQYVPPSEPTIRRALQNVDAAELELKVGKWRRHCVIAALLRSGLFK